MKNLKLVILLVIIFVLGLSGIYYIYDLNINKKSQATASPTPSSQANFPTVSPSPSATPAGAVAGSNALKNQPTTGSDISQTASLAITRPSQGETVKSPLTVTGFINSQNATISLVDANGSTIGTKDFTCSSNKSCYFEATIEFQKPNTIKGTILLTNSPFTEAIDVNF